MLPPDKSSGVRHVQVSSDREGQRLDNFLSAQLKGLPKSAIYRMIRTGQVRINGKRCKPASRLEEGDAVRIPPARVRGDGPVTVSDRVCAQLHAAILFQDSDLMVVNKPSGMAVHSGSGLPWGLIDVLRQMHPGEYFELAHRLDRETSGCLVLARNGRSLNHLTRLFRQGNLQKYYLCLLDGRMKEPAIEVDVALKKVQAGPEREVIASEDGKAALTRFRLLQSWPDCSYAEAQILTGRTHQIRVHALHLGMPLAGDQKYARPESVSKWKSRGLHRTFLHAQRLVFDAISGEELQFEAPLPEALKSVLDRLES
jgi:23S rRNA pseudouridine955/2504/2580 synthase